ncbi:MAG TPA: DUF1572 family protein [Bacteroidota bacterium]|nr:DUF1572 family protein [Bacteroidota bacterium]
MNTSSNPIESAKRTFETYKGLADKAMAQVSDDEFFRFPESESNSIAFIVKHVAGNLMSRWTDFLSSDGEKPWRNRDAEFESDSKGRATILSEWEEGWICLFRALGSLTQQDLPKIVTIRNEPHSVLEAINRGLAHTSYHVGQIVLLAKLYKSASWKTLTIPRRKKPD